MRTNTLINLAALVTGTLVLALAFILVPDRSWSPVAVTSVGAFALAAGFAFYFPSAFVRRLRSNAAQTASLGSLGIVSALPPVMTAGASAFALSGMDKPALALDVLSAGVFLITLFILRASLDVVAEAASSSAPSMHLAWQSKVQALGCAATDNSVRSALDALAERLRYAASDLPGGYPHDLQIDREIRSIADRLAVDGAAEIQPLIARVALLIEEREIFLRSARSRA